MIKKMAIPLFDSGTIILCISDNINDELRKYGLEPAYNDEEIKTAYAYVEQLMNEDEDGLVRPTWVVVFRKSLDRKKLYNCAGHEIVHLLNYMCDRYGLSKDVDHDEGLAYLSGWLMETIMLEFDKVNPHSKKGQRRRAH